LHTSSSSSHFGVERISAKCLYRINTLITASSFATKIAVAGSRTTWALQKCCFVECKFGDDDDGGMIVVCSRIVQLEGCLSGRSSKEVVVMEQDGVVWEGFL
jgi:hypothetical protein